MAQLGKETPRRIRQLITCAILVSLVFTLPPSLTAAPIPLVQFANWSAWNSYFSNVPVPGAGCFKATYPSVVWQPSKCGIAAPIPLRSSLPLTVGGGNPVVVGNGNDEVAYSSGTLIGSSFGSFQSVTGVTSETDSEYGVNEFGLQVNSQFFATSSPYTNNEPLTCVYPTYVCGWEQFVFLNDPSGVYGTQIYIQYWLINYYTNYGYCPSTAPPGGGFDGQPWYAYEGSCVSNSPGILSLPTETAQNLANLVLRGYANFGSALASCTTACDEVVVCYSGASCYAVAITDQVVNLYQNWHYSEFNVFGIGGGSEANFNSGTTITVVNSLKDQSGNVIVPSCVNTGYTGEENNLNLVSCSSNSNGQIVFTESNGNTVTFNTNPTSFVGASSAGSIGACGGTFTNGQSSTNCGSSFSATANLPSPSSQWQFLAWEWSGGVSCTSNTANPTTCTVTSSGSLKADYSAQIIFYTTPSNQGSISWGSCSNPGETNGQSIFDVNLPPEFTNANTACANVPSGYSFSGWSVAGGLSLSTSSSSPTTVTVTGPGSLTATFTATLTPTVSLSPTSGLGGTNVLVSGSNFATSDTGCLISSSPTGLISSPACTVSSGTASGSFTVANVATGAYTVTVTGTPTSDSASATFTVVTPQVTTDKSTYIQDEYLQYSGTGFTPSGAVLSCISTNNDGNFACVGSNADAQGDVSGSMQVGTNISPGPETFLMVDETTGIYSNSVPITVIELTITTTATQTVTTTSTTLTVTSSTSTSETTTTTAITSTSTTTVGQVCSATTSTTSTSVAVAQPTVTSTTTSSSTTRTTATSTSATTTYLTSTSTSMMVTTATVTACTQTVTSTSTSFTTTTSQIPQVTMTVSYLVVGGGTPEPPTFNYIQSGVQQTYTLTDTPTAISVDAGSSWSVTPNPLTGSSSTQQWFSGQSLSGTASASTSTVFTFYNQGLQTLSFTIVNGTSTGTSATTTTKCVKGCGLPSASSPIYSAPQFTADSLGVSTSVALTTTPTGYWFDDGSSWSVTNPLAGSSSSEQWVTSQSTGTITVGQSLIISYQDEVMLTATANPANGGAVTPSSGWQDPGDTVSLQATPTDATWQFSGWTVTGASCSGDSTVSPCTFSMPDNAVTVTATFTQLGSTSTTTTTFSSTVTSFLTTTSSTSSTTSLLSTYTATSTLSATTLNPVVTKTTTTTMTTTGTAAKTSTTTFTSILTTATGTSTTILSTGRTTRLTATTTGTATATSTSSTTALSTTTSAGMVTVSQTDMFTLFLTTIIQTLLKFVNEVLKLLGTRPVVTPKGEKVIRVIKTVK